MENWKEQGVAALNNSELRVFVNLCAVLVPFMMLCLKNNDYVASNKNIHGIRKLPLASFLTFDSELKNIKEH